MMMMATTTHDAMARTHGAEAMTALGKRSLEQCTRVVGCDDAPGRPVDSNASPKRLRCDSPAPPSPESDGLFVWDGIKCDPEDIACRDHIAFVAADDASPVSDLVVVLAEAGTYQVELAMLRLFSSGVAFSRICRALASTPTISKNLNLEALAYRAAHENRPAIVSTMMYRLCKEDDVERALLTAVEEDDLVAVKAIDTACLSTDNMSGDSYRRLTRGALYEAAQAGRAAIAAYLATVCNNEAIEEALSMCINTANKDDHLDSDDDEEDEGDDDAEAQVEGAESEAETAAKAVAVFAALWEHADACAHYYIARLAPCPIRDYLADRIAQGEPCADSCMSNLSDDSDEEEDDDEEDDDDGDEDDGTTDCNEDDDTQGGR